MTGSTRRVVLIVLVGQQTGFDPANPQVGMAPPPPPQYYGQPQAAQGGLLRARREAPHWERWAAATRARGGQWGQGGCAVYTAQRQNAMARGRSNYERAFGACMSSRGYTVR